MRAFWLTYRDFSAAGPEALPIAELRQLVRRFQVNAAATTAWWPLPASADAAASDRVYLFRQGKGPRGIFGSGHILERRRAGDDAAAGLQCRLRFDRLVDPWAGMLLPLEAAAEFLPAALVQAETSGLPVPPAIIPAIESLLRRAGPARSLGEA